MRVIHVINSLNGSGGAEQGLVREIVHFDDQVDNLVLRLFDPDDLLGELEASQRIRVKPLGMRAASSAWNWPEAARRVGREVRRFRPDVIHTSLFVGNLVGQLAAARANLPVMSTFTLTGDRQLHRQLQPGAGTIRAATLRRIAANVGRRENTWYRALSNDAADTNCELMGIDRSRVTVIPRGVPLSRHSPDKARFGIPDDARLLVNVGRLAAQKGQGHLLHSFRRIKDRIPAAHLAIAGKEGDAAGTVARVIAELGLRDSVHLLGYRRDLPILLESADVFLSSSLAEGLGTAILEAMAVDLPVVAFDVPAIREMTDSGKYATLVPIGDVEGLAAAAMGILNRGTRASTSSWVAGHFGLPLVASQVQQALFRVVQAQRQQASSSKKRDRQAGASHSSGFSAS